MSDYAKRMLQAIDVEEKRLMRETVVREYRALVDDKARYQKMLQPEAIDITNNTSNTTSKTAIAAKRGTKRGSITKDLENGALQAVDGLLAPVPTRVIFNKMTEQGCDIPGDDESKKRQRVSSMLSRSKKFESKGPDGWQVANTGNIESNDKGFEAGTQPAMFHNNEERQ